MPSLFNAFRAQTGKVRDFFKESPSKLGKMLPNFRRCDSRHCEEQLNQATTTNVVHINPVQSARQEVTMLRDEAVNSRKDIQKTVKLLRFQMKMNLDMNERECIACSNCGGSSVVQVINGLEEELKEVNDAIRNLNFFLVQNARGGSYVGNAITSNQGIPVQR